MKLKQSQRCLYCNGTGWGKCPSITCAHSCPCSVCAGSGRIVVKTGTCKGGTEVQVALPAGVEIINQIEAGGGDE